MQSRRNFRYTGYKHHFTSICTTGSLNFAKWRNFLLSTYSLWFVQDISVIVCTEENYDAEFENFLQAVFKNGLKFFTNKKSRKHFYIHTYVHVNGKDVTE
jgi:hypothetical protein